MRGQEPRGLSAPSGLRHRSLPSEQGASSLLTEAWAPEWLSGCFRGHRGQGQQTVKGHGMRGLGLCEGVRPPQRAIKTARPQARGEGGPGWVEGVSLGSLGLWVLWGHQEVL